VGDGCKIFTGIVPSNGILNFSTYANLITAGLPYKMRVKPTKPILTAQGMTSRGMKQKLNRVTLSIYQGIGGQMGIDKDHLYDIEYGASSYGGDPTMFTGEITRDIEGDFEEKIEYVIENDEPFPFTLRGIVFRMSINQD
jgi:hypothetical protein